MPALASSVKQGSEIMLVMIVTMLVAIEHIGIMLLEIFASPDRQARAFDVSLEYAKQPAARISFANQGIYNGALGLAMIISNWLFTGATLILVWQMFLVFIMVVALFGGFTATKKIWGLQFLPAVIAFVLTLI